MGNLFVGLLLPDVYEQLLHHSFASLHISQHLAGFQAKGLVVFHKEVLISLKSVICLKGR